VQAVVSNGCNRRSDANENQEDDDGDEDAEEGDFSSAASNFLFAHGYNQERTSETQINKNNRNTASQQRETKRA